MNKYLLSLIVTGSVILCSHAAQRADERQEETMKQLEQQLAAVERQLAIARGEPVPGKDIHRLHLEFRLTAQEEVGSYSACSVTVDGVRLTAVKSVDGETYRGLEGDRVMSPEEAKAAFEKHYIDFLPQSNNQ